MRTAGHGPHWRPFRSKCRGKCLRSLPLTEKRVNIFSWKSETRHFSPWPVKVWGRQGEEDWRRDGPCVALLFPSSRRRGTGEQGQARVSRLPCILPDKSALGRGWGVWGRRGTPPALAEGFPFPPAGPRLLGDTGALRASTAERDRKAAAGRARQATREPYGHRQQSATERRPQAVPVRRRRSLTGIDSRARGSPSPQMDRYP